MSRRFLAVPLVVVALALVVPRGASAGPQAVAPASASTIPGNLLAQDLRPFLQERAAAGNFPTNIVATTSAPSGNISPNLHFVSNLPLPAAISVAFIGDVAFVSTVLGLYSVDISDPTNPVILGAVPEYIWENEHIQADPQRHLVFVSRDPRGFTTPATTAFPYGAIEIYDVSNPRVMVPVAYHLQPTGHTAGCIDQCHFLWIAGPASPAVQVANGADPSWGGRPMWGEDITDPANPVDCGHFLDLGNHGGTTDYDHDIDVDANGVAWVSGSGHVRGYWTTGSHLNPLTGHVETATPCSPIPYAGGNTDEGQLLVQDGVMHNSWHNLSLAVDGRRGDVLTATEEVVTTDCTKAGRFLTYDLGGTYHGEGWTNAHSTLHRLDAWTPENQPGSTGCDSAHWFTDRGDGLIAQAFYTQGTRILDVRNPRHITQVGYYNVNGTDTWSAYWHGHNEIVVADVMRGLDILRYDDTPATAATPPGGNHVAPQPDSGVLPTRSTGAPQASVPNTATVADLRDAAPLSAVGIVALLLAGRRRRITKPPFERRA
jgi:hypothetical protein